MSVAVIRSKELAVLPVPTLEAMAKAAARDVDAGDDKRALLERLIKTIQEKLQ